MRVTVDWDGLSEFESLKNYFNMRRMVGVDEIRKSTSGGRNYHGISRGNPLSKEEQIRIRRILGEDPIRLDFDEEDNHKPKQILWSQKITEEGGVREIEELDERNILALPFNSKIPRGAYL